MAVGFRARGDALNVQIDDSYFNFALSTSASVTLAFASGIAVYQSTITVTGTSPIIAWSGASGPVTLISVSQSGSSWTFTLASNAAYTLRYFVFDVPANAGSPASAPGLRVRNAAGAVTFDSRLKYLRVAAVRSIDTWNEMGHDEGGSPVVVSLPTGRTYASAVSLLGVLNDPGETVSIDPITGNPTSHFHPIVHALGCYVSGSTMYSNWVAVNFGTSNPNLTFTNSNGQTLAIDVTNY